jgi:hypothetical protein
MYYNRTSTRNKSITTSKQKSVKERNDERNEEWRDAGANSATIQKIYNRGGEMNNSEYCIECGYPKPVEEMNYKLCPDCREDIESDEDWWR